MHTNLVHVAILMHRDIISPQSLYILCSSYATTLSSFDVDNPVETFIVKALPLCDLINGFRAQTKILV